LLLSSSYFWSIGHGRQRVEFDDERFLLRQERRRSFQQLANEAFADLLEKHHKPVDLKSQLRERLSTEAEGSKKN
jgi:hypothetical protein